MQVGLHRPEMIAERNARQTSPIAHLPVELLIQIFVDCAQDSEDDPLIALTISHVCKSWREIAYDSPRIWQYLSLDDRRPRLCSEFQIRWWMLNSGTLPMDITLHISDHDKLLPLIIPLFEYMPRWRKCAFRGKIQEEMDFSAYTSSEAKAHLRELRIVIRDPSDLEESDLEEGSRNSPTIVQAPCHINTSSYDITFRCSVLTLPLPSLMTPFHVTKLVICESTFEGPTDPLRMLEFLSFCPSVEYFQYQGLPHDPAYSNAVIPSIVKLPNLRTFVIHSSCAVRTLLSHIDAPNLTELHLEHTNTECDFATSPAYPYAVEDGDSDDEAGDFSQSPWSDHATGMGLRSLIRRSNPPLEVLLMDYADMRTKDFQWCFSRLNHLRQFRIVASDMSDKVIAMFAPYRAPRVLTSLDDDDMIFDLELDRPLHLRLPLLSSLELWNCQRLSGRAIVKALTERVRFTDAVADEGVYSRMEEIGIVGCGGFSDNHALELENVAGNRLRTN
ncbi:unnamed protein product [Somion occarium]